MSISTSSRNWWEQAVVYQIYPRSFADSDGDGVGDLRGVVSRLDHLSRLGVDAIWLSPIFESPMADFGYDISDHCRVDPLFGGDDDARLLIEEAHRRGIRVLFDLVLGHTSDRHRWFQASRQDRTNPYRDFYVWRDGPTPGRADGGPPNNWEAGFPAGARAWTFDDLSGQWYLHSHLPQQPDLNWENPIVADEQERVLRFWLDAGIDGVRLDSINRLGKDPLLRDNAPGLPLRQQDWPNLHERLVRVRSVLDKYPGTLAVGEVWLFDQQLLVPYLSDDELHLAHNFVFARADADATGLAAILSEFGDLVPDPGRAAWFVSNHDEPRPRSRFDRDGYGLQRAELIAMLLASLRGTTFLYQGEELGLADTPIPPDRVVDLNGRDPQRTPMPWRAPSVSGPGAGFTTGRPWLPITPDAEAMNVESQRTDARSTLNLYRRLIGIRRDRLRAVTGRHLADVPVEGVLRVVNQVPAGRYETLLNFGVEGAVVPIPDGARLLIGTDRDRRDVGPGRVELGGLEGVMVEHRYSEVHER
ncbi:alpha-amylase family glycosyl hydrolase [Actinoallomurus acaciae]|uniref:Alpha-amylase family glycosyl hydrolase n=1 Tax=Actinoallomurus acaciae TaxID=502577 RepID=A0ABV5YWD9_9ACTN